MITIPSTIMNEEPYHASWASNAQDASSLCGYAEKPRCRTYGRIASQDKHIPYEFRQPCADFSSS